MHLLNLHECNYTQGEAITLWEETIKDISLLIAVTTFLDYLKVGMILNVRLISLEYDNISTETEIYISGH